MKSEGAQTGQKAGSAPPGIKPIPSSRQAMIACSDPGQAALWAMTFCTEESARMRS